MREIEVGHLSFDVHEKGKPQEKLDLNEAIGTLIKKQRFIDADAVVYNNHRIHLADVRISQNKKHLSFLFFSIDTVGVPKPLVDITTLNLRKIIKEKGEGIANSAHVVVRLSRNEKTNQYDGLMELQEGIPRSVIIQILNNIFQKYITYPRVDKSKNADITPVVKVAVGLDKPVSEQISAVRLISIEFVRRRSLTAIDQADGFIEARRSVLYQPEKRTVGKAIKKAVQELMSRGTDSDYEEVKLHLEEDGEPRTVSTKDRHKTDILTKAFQKKEIISDLPDVEVAATLEIIPEVAIAMAKNIP